LTIKTGVSAIANEVIGDVQKEAEAIISTAENHAKETLRVAKEQANQTYRAILDEAKEKAEAEKRKIESIAEVEIRNRLLQTKETLVDLAFEKTLVKLKNFVKTEEYQTYLLKLIEEIAKKMDQEVLVIEVNAKDKGWLKPDMLKHASKKLNIEFKMSKQTQDYIGGCKIQTEDGKIVYDATLDNRLEELKPELRAEIAKRLFGEVA
jgi:V/A-type H+-transporting ATPase subunit E